MFLAVRHTKNSSRPFCRELPRLVRRRHPQRFHSGALEITHIALQCHNNSQVPKTLRELYPGALYVLYEHEMIEKPPFDMSENKSFVPESCSQDGMRDKLMG